VCVTLTECKKDEEYQSKAQTATTDRECKALTVCKDNEEETEAPTPTSDRVCFEPPVSLGIPSMTQFKYRVRTKRFTTTMYPHVKSELL
jgi:hypothetical protein